MNRRDLIKALGLMGASLTMPPLLGRQGFAANISQRELLNARAIINGEIDFIAPASLPTVINVFMYGGPSELAGNLLNIEEITGPVGSKGKSQNDYKAARQDITQPFTAATNTGQVTSNFLWKNAGGLIMEDLLSAKQMSLYRTINRVQGASKAHRECIFTNQTGGLATTNAPGMGTTLAAILRVKMPQVFDIPDKAPIMPFVSFEGETVMYDLGDIDLPVHLRSLSLGADLKNPYSYARAFNGSNPDPVCVTDSQVKSCSSMLEQLAQSVSGGYSTHYGKYVNSFSKRIDVDEKFNTRFKDMTLRMPTTITGGGPFGDFPTANTVAPTSFLQGTTPINQGTLNFSNGFGIALRNAVLFALLNKDTRFITLSTGGLGGWDDHDNSIFKYEQRMLSMLSDLRNAVRLLRTGTATAGSAGAVLDGNARNDVVINVFGEFGRNVNLNDSLGWDHGNNMNLYTFGGSAIPGRVLGQVVGTTKIIDEGGQNRLYTTPDLANDARTFQPYSIAATVYKYFGVQNPNVLTADAVLAPNGYGPIDG